MKTRWAIIVIGLLLPLLLSNCGSATTGALTGAILHGATRTGRTMAEGAPQSSPLQGKINNNVYTSPNGTFHFKMPKAIPPRTIRDGFPPAAKDTWVVAFNYPNCNGFSISEKRGNLQGASLEEWVNKNVVAEAEKIGVTIKERKLIQTRYGSAIFIRALLPRGGVCQVTQYQRGKTSFYMADADLAQYIFYFNGYFYRVNYAQDVFYAAGYNPATVEPTLKEFFSGLEILTDVH